ncbi:MAG: hypothetical protein AB1505_04025 [Candidatus Latescibacterota bacterium]
MSSSLLRRVGRVVSALSVLLGSAAAQEPTAVTRVELRLAPEATAALRAVPVTSGVPMPRGELRRPEQVRLLHDGVEVPAQFRVTGRWWPDEDIRWLLVDLQADVGPGRMPGYVLEYGEGVQSRARPAVAVRVAGADGAWIVDTGAAVFTVSGRRFTLFDEVRLADGRVAVPPPSPGPQARGAVLGGLRPLVTRPIPDEANRGASHLIYVRNLGGRGQEDYRLRFVTGDEYEVTGAAGPVGRGRWGQDFRSSDGRIAIPADAWLVEAPPRAGDAYTFRAVDGEGETWSEGIFASEVVESGPLRTVLQVTGAFGPTAAPVLELTAWYHFYAGSASVKLAFALENNAHGGRTATANAANAEIGGVNCVFFDGMELVLPLAGPGAHRALLLGDGETADVCANPLAETLELYQDSNGGAHWDRYRDPRYHPRPNSFVSFRGYRVQAGERVLGQGHRAPGVLAVRDGRCGLFAAVADFWQNYPKALAVTADGRVRVGLFPGRYGGDFPLRSGEHKTHEVLLGFGDGTWTATELRALATCFAAPLRAEPSPQWFAQSGALGALHPYDPAHYPDYETFNLSSLGIFGAGQEAGPNLPARREEFDFYGWMDYGDVPTDFESGTGPWGMKYDMDFHMAQHYARSLHPGWFALFGAAARHARDVDIHHQPHYPGLHFVKGGVWAHSLHDEPGHRNPHRNYNHFTKDLAFGARSTAALYYLTGDWKGRQACLEIAENALAEYMSPQAEPDPAERNRMGWRGDACTLQRLLEGYLLTGEERFRQRAAWVVRDCAFDGHPAEHEPISLWSSTFYMMALARYVEVFPGDTAARGYLLAHLQTLDRACQRPECMPYTITPQPDGAVVGEGSTSMYNVMGADALAVAYLLTGDGHYLDTARRCFAYGVASLGGGPPHPTYQQVHTANGALHGNLFMQVEARLREPLAPDTREGR